MAILTPGIQPTHNEFLQTVPLVADISVNSLHRLTYSNVGDFVMATDLRCWRQNHYISEFLPVGEVTDFPEHALVTNIFVANIRRLYLNVLNCCHKVVANKFCLQFPSPISMWPTGQVRSSLVEPLEITIYNENIIKYFM